MKVSYADHADVLYLVFDSSPHKSTYVESDNGIIVRMDDATHRVTGITIPDFLRRFREGADALSVPQLGDTGIESPAEWYPKGA